MSNISGYMGVYKPRPENINRPVDGDGNTYLHELCRKKAPAEVLRDAVESGASLSVVNANNFPPIGVAILQGDIDAVRELAALGSPLYIESTARNAPFNAMLLAVLSNRDGMLEAVLAAGGGLYVNHAGTDEKGQRNDLPCLHLAIRYHRFSALGPLMSAGAFLDRGAGSGNVTPLMLAATLNSPHAVEVLVRAGASLDAANPLNGYTALHYAALNDKTAVAEKLIEEGADVNARGLDGITPLHLAVAGASDRMIEALLKAKADPNAVMDTPERQNALMAAARKGNAQAVALLLEAGADPTLADAFNKTAAAIAQEYNFPGISCTLRDKENEIHIKRAEDFLRRKGP